MTLNIAHRGARSLAPENTLAAARRAHRIGADLWETDVLVSQDGALILMHDDTLRRTTDAAARFPGRKPWAVSAFSYAEIRSLDAGSWFASSDPFGQIAAGRVGRAEVEAYRGERVPTLLEALHFTRENDWRINIELKRPAPPMDRFPLVEALLDCLAAVDMDPRQVIVSSFEHEWLHQVRRCRPELAVQALIGPGSAKRLDWEHPAFQTYNPHVSLVDATWLRRAAIKGLTLNVYTVNEASTMRRLVTAGVGGLFTDFPQRLAGILRTSGGPGRS